MNDDERKPGVVIDVDPETDADPVGATDQTGAPEEVTSPRSTKASPWAMILAGVAIAGVAGATWLGYQLSGQIDARLTSVEHHLAETTQASGELGEQLTALELRIADQGGTLGEQQAVLAQQRLTVQQARSAFETQERRLAEENLRLQEREAELRAAVADVHRRVGRSGTQWMIAETEYLLRIASHRLMLARDPLTAQAALQLADQRLRDTQDPGWAGVREQIARDIASLDAFEAPDIAGLSARLAALVEQVPQLSIARATIGPQRTLPERGSRDPEDRSWDTLLDDLWSGFKDSVRIRERDQPVAAMLAPEQQFFLYENLKLHLESARLGLARGDQALFDGNLTSAQQWLADYFQDDPVAGAISDTLEDMRGIDIRPPMPDISQSLRALAVRRQMLDALPAPETAATDAPPPAAEAQ
jgi:uroporphyrin-3 C-methyltransferase